MPQDQSRPLQESFNRLGIAIEFRRNAASFSSFTAALKDPSRIVEWGQIREVVEGGVYKLAGDEHFSGYGETEDLALEGLKKRFRRTSVEDSVLLIKTSENATGARYTAVKSDGADGVMNMGSVVTERTDSGNRVREIALKR